MRSVPSIWPKVCEMWAQAPIWWSFLHPPCPLKFGKSNQFLFICFIWCILIKFQHTLALSSCGLSIFTIVVNCFRPSLFSVFLLFWRSSLLFSIALFPLHLRKISRFEAASLKIVSKVGFRLRLECFESGNTKKDFKRNAGSDHKQVFVHLPKVGNTFLKNTKWMTFSTFECACTYFKQVICAVVEKKKMIMVVVFSDGDDVNPEVDRRRRSTVTSWVDARRSSVCKWMWVERAWVDKPMVCFSDSRRVILSLV